MLCEWKKIKIIEAYEKFLELKYKYRNKEFWCRGYYVDTAGKKYKKDRGIYQKTIGRRPSRRTADNGKLLRNPFTGSK